MEKKGYIWIPKLYNHYVCYLGRFGGKRHDINYCADCGHEYSGLWKERFLLGGAISCAGDYPYCPQCGNHHEVAAGTCEVALDSSVPLSMELTLWELKSAVKLVIKGDDLIPSESGDWYKRKYQEVYRFDVLRRKTTFTRKVQGNPDMTELEIGNPLDVRMLAHESDLQMLRETMTTLCRKERILAMMKNLREMVTEKLEKVLGHKINSLYTIHDTEHGLCLFPLYNIAYRMIFTDSNNLPHQWRGKVYEWQSGKVVDSIVPGMRAKDINLDVIRSAKSTVAGVIESFKLPDVSWVRKALSENIFGAGIIRRLSYLFHDPNCASKLYNRRTELNLLCRIHNWHVYDEPQGYRRLIKLFGEPGAIRISNQKNFRDTLRMMSSINTKTFAGLMRSKPKLKRIHDTLTDALYEEEHPHIDFDNRNAVRKRLAMQTDMVKFFLPGASEDLISTGKELHNCVGSYVNRVASGMTHIVRMSDDRGKLTACLEVSKGALVQAKLRCNRQAREDSKVNAEIIARADSLGIDYSRCSDVREVRLPVLLVA